MLGILNIIKTPIINLYNLFNNDLELYSYTSSFTHSICITASISYFLYTNNYENLKLLKNVSYLYLISDSILLFSFDLFSKIRNIYLFHHLLFLFTWNLYSYDPNLFCKILLSEISVITLNLKYFNKRINGKYDKFLGLITYFLFFTFRIINITYHLNILYNREWYFMMPVAVPITLLQYYWFYLMTLKAYKIYNSNI